MGWDYDIWRQGFQTCEECGERYHLSGEYECACRECESEECEATTIDSRFCTECEDKTSKSSFDTPREALEAVLSLTLESLGQEPESISEQIVRAQNIHANGGK